MCCASMQVPDLENAYCLSFKKEFECGETGSMKNTQTYSKFTVPPLSIQPLVSMKQKEGRLSSCLVYVIVIWLQSSVILCIWTLFLSPHAVLQLKLQQRRTREELVSQGIMPRKSHFAPLVTLSITHICICECSCSKCRLQCIMSLLLGMFVQAAYMIAAKFNWTLKSHFKKCMNICALYIKILN